MSLCFRSFGFAVAAFSTVDDAIKINSIRVVFWVYDFAYYVLAYYVLESSDKGSRDIMHDTFSRGFAGVAHDISPVYGLKTKSNRVT